MNALRDFWRRFRRNRAALAGLMVLGGVLAMALSAKWLFPVDPWDMVAAPSSGPGRTPS